MLFSGRKKISYFRDMIAKIEKKLAGWKGKLLSTGGRLALIKHVLHSTSIHILTVFDLPKVVFQRLESVISDFFWGQTNFGQRSLG